MKKRWRKRSKERRRGPNMLASITDSDGAETRSQQKGCLQRFLWGLTALAACVFLIYSLFPQDCFANEDALWCGWNVLMEGWTVTDLFWLPQSVSFSHVCASCSHFSFYPDFIRFVDFIWTVTDYGKKIKLCKINCSVWSISRRWMCIHLSV